MEYGGVHECDAMKRMKRFLVWSVPIVRRRERGDGGNCVLELRAQEGAIYSREINIVYCPFCGENLAR